MLIWKQVCIDDRRNLHEMRIEEVIVVIIKNMHAAHMISFF